MTRSKRFLLFCFAAIALAGCATNKMNRTADLSVSERANVPAVGWTLNLPQDLPAQ